MKFVKSPLALATSFGIAQMFVFSAVNATESVDAMEVITVNSDFRQSNLQKVPSTLSVLGSKDIALRNAQNLEEIIAISPNVNLASGSSRARYYQIRGIGERSQFQEPINPSVGLIIDDIDFTGIGSIASTFDVAQTEIFRGPQGTRFGANAMAGLINITTNAPTDTFESSLRLTAGNYDSYGAGVVLSGPANDAINYRVAIEQFKSDGFIENSYLNRDDTNNRDELTMRGKLAITASDDLTIDVSLLHVNFDNGYDAFSLDNTRETFSDEPGFDKQETTAFSSKFTYTGFNRADMVTIISYADSNLAYGYDEDWAYGEYQYNPDDLDNGIYNPDPCITPTGCLAEFDGYSSKDHYFRDRTTVTAEVRLLSNQQSKLFSQTTTWIAGIYAKEDSEDLARQYTYLSSDYGSSFDTNTLAVYAQFDSSLTKKLNLITGIRVEQRKADYSNTDALTFAPTDTMVGGKVVLSYQLDNDNLVYGSINRGYKAGGVNTDGSLPENLREFEPEYVINYELGYKVSLLNNQAYIRAAVFYMDRTDIQVKTSLSSIRPDGSVEFTPYLGNGASGFNRGVEVESAWQLNDSIELYGALGLLDTEFSDFTNSDGVDLSGREQAHAPNYQVNMGMNYQPNEQWLVNVSVDGKDGYYFSDSHDEKSDSSVVLNASINYLQENWQVKLWARNLLDEDIATRGFYFGNDPRDSYTAKGYQQFAEPMVMGVTLDYQF